MPGVAPGAEAAVGAEEEKPPPPANPAGRDRYFDTLRAVALIRVVTYHTFGWAWAGLVMLVHGWMPGWQIVYWVVPLGDPPGNAWGEQAWEILWYLRTYLWFVLLSPLLLKVFRLAPVPVLFLSLAPILVLNFAWPGPDNRVGSAMWDLSTYLFCARDRADPGGAADRPVLEGARVRDVSAAGAASGSCSASAGS